jgi:hypothetical protein
MSRYWAANSRLGCRPWWGALAIALGAAVAGCDSPGPTAGKLTAVKAEGDPVVLALKDGTPYVTANVADDLPTLSQGDAAAREDALIRRAVQIAIERAVNHKPYAGKDEFVVRLIVLHELDEYGRAKSGSALELATVTVPRTSLDGLTASQVANLAGPDLKKLVRNPTVNLGNLDKFV